MWPPRAGRRGCALCLLPPEGAAASLPTAVCSLCVWDQSVVSGLPHYCGLDSPPEGLPASILICWPDIHVNHSLAP